MEVTRHELLTDKMSLHFFELKKLPDNISPDNMLLLWLSLFKADTQEELEKIKSLEVPIMEKAINAYHKITVSPEFRNLERMREDAYYNQAATVQNAEKKTKKEIARNLFRIGVPEEKIIEATGLTGNEIENLRNSN